MLRRPVQFVVAAVFAASTCAQGMASAASPAEERVRQATLRTYIHGMTAEIAAREVGAGGVPALVRLLSEPAFPRPDNVVAFLAELGTAAETAPLLRYLDEAATQRPEADRALLLVPQALGMIASRGAELPLGILLDATADRAQGGPFAGGRAGTVREDLVERAVYGLAWSGHPAALARLEALAAGAVVPLPEGRDLRAAARNALGIAAILGAARRSGAARPIPSAVPAPGPPAAALGAVGPPDAVIDVADQQTRVHESGLTYANHVEVTDPVNDTRVDRLLGDATLLMGRADFDIDVACCCTLRRTGSARTFGSQGDGLDVIDDTNELATVLNDTTARVKVVRAINFCSAPGTNIIGCAWISGNGMGVVRLADQVEEGLLWAHEYGHNTGRDHNADTRFIMFDTIGTDNTGLTAAECDAFHAPNTNAGMTVTDIGACADTEPDDVHDELDNCVGVRNSDQLDVDGDGRGDFCDNCRGSANADQADTDGDGAGDACDTCPFFADPGQADGDGDGTGDACESDDDGDGVPDVADNCPRAWNRSQNDSDADAVGDVCDTCWLIPNPHQDDADGDRLGDICDNCSGAPNPGQTNVDLDALGDACDVDDDNDGLTDVDEAALGTDPRRADTDGDGLSDRTEVRVYGTDPRQPDTDGDGAHDGADTCRLVADPNQGDADGDGFGDPCDNCDALPNPDQKDCDQDRHGAACDADDDADGVDDAVDNCLCRHNPVQVDSDGDGAGDACDVCRGTPDLACIARIDPLQFVDRGAALACLRSGGSATCALGDFRPPGDGGCPPWLASREGCCPAGARCPGPAVTLLDPAGGEPRQFMAGRFGFAPDSAFGADAAFVPDLDGDGLVDIAIGAPLADPGGLADAGSVLVVSQGSGEPLRRFDGRAAGEEFGAAVELYDGTGRLVIGAPGAASPKGAERAGAVRVFDTHGAFERSIAGAGAGAAFGTAISVVPDIDGDGAPDLVITAPGRYPDPARTGEVSLHTLAGTRLLLVRGGTPGDGFGLAAALLSPPTGHAGADSVKLAVGMPFDPASSGAGSVRLYDLRGEPIGFLGEGEPGDEFGRSLSWSGDLDGDGSADLIVGAPGSDLGGAPDMGAWYAFSGTELRDLSKGAQPGERFGQRIFVARDASGDGLPDLFVHAPYRASGESTGAESYYSSDGAPDEAACGNGIVEGAEECEPTAATPCCTGECRLVAAGEVCRGAGPGCDAPDACSGLAAACPDDLALLDGSACDDASPCTSSDVCDAGACRGTPVTHDQVHGVRVSVDGRTLYWPAVAAGYDVARGGPEAWPDAVGTPGATCLASSRAENWLTDPGIPAAASTAWYLVRAHDACSAGDYGASSSGAPRSVSACP
ncbi:MAG: thrombospondin type 3 repeat-containing protein [Acidobacteria bacterium]|nr:thrombospondin type 3 repeat-containing protein [Acidobacteriota bacterium]